MKHFLMGLGVLGMLSLTACSTNDDPNGGGNVENGESHYLAVNIVPTADNGTRGPGDQMGGDPNDAIYEEGYKNENAVTSARFYFFDNDGNPMSVKATGSTNFMDWTPEDTGNKDMPNVEKILKAVLIIKTPDGDNQPFPTQMFTVLNPQSDVLGNASLSLSELLAKTDNHVEAATTKKDNFVMTTSVYAASEGTADTEKVTTAITSANFRSTEAAALANPITVYVERTVAKLRVRFDKATGVELLEGGSYKVALKNAGGENILVNGKQVYAVFSGFNVTATTNKSYLSKHINSAWSANLFDSSEPWNWSPYFRSFWAVNCDKAGQEYDTYLGIYNPTDKKGAQFGIKKGDVDTNAIYLEENAANDFATGMQREFPTKAILAATLVDEDNNPIELTQWIGQQFVGQDALKTAMLEYLQNTKNSLYSSTTADGKTTYSEMTAADFEFKTSMNAGVAQPGEENKGRYYVYLQLSAAGEAKTWHKSNAEENNPVVSKEDVNKYLRDVLDHAKIWTAGQTYYYFNIRHLTPKTQPETTPGYYGVVRNHIYDVNIDMITGLGTPVYDPNEKIYPEKPQDEETFVAAQINILSWRLVPSNVHLEW